MRLTCVLLMAAWLLFAPFAQVEAQTVSTPTPTSTSTSVSPLTSTSTPASTSAPALTPLATPQSQSPSDQIASVALQVAQIANDPSMPVDVKTQQINALAAQFNQLVLVWQQQIAALPAGVGTQTTLPPPAPGTLAALATSTPTPVVNANATANATATPPGSTIPGASTSATPRPPGSVTPDQIRAQISAVSQLMTTVSNDPTIPSDVKTVRLQDLGNQFNQLILQLQQVS